MTRRRAWLALLLATLALSGCVSQADVTAACEDHGGVVDYEDHSWGSTDGTGTAVCKDGTARRVK